MKDIFIISENREMFNLFHSVLGRLPIHLSWARDMEEALGSFPQERPSLVFIVNEDEKALTEWVERFNATGVHTPFVCFTRPLSWVKLKMIWDKGAIEVIRLPMLRKELEYIVKTIVAEREETDVQRNKAQGKLADVNLIELIQNFEDGRKSGVLNLQNGSQNGRIEFSKGNIANAELDNCDPMEAIEIMATWFSGRYRSIIDDKKYRRTIKVNNQQIILDSLNHINAQQKLLKELPDRFTLLFADPELNYEESAATSRQVLLLFRDGLTLSEFLEKYTGKVNPILSKLKKWLTNGILLTKEQYEEKRKKIGKTTDSGGLKKIVSKVFNKDEIDNKNHIASGPIEENVIDSINKRPHLFENMEILKSFLTEIEDES